MSVEHHREREVTFDVDDDWAVPDLAELAPPGGSVETARARAGGDLLRHGPLDPAAARPDPAAPGGRRGRRVAPQDPGRGRPDRGAEPGGRRRDPAVPTASGGRGGGGGRGPAGGHDPDHPAYDPGMRRGRRRGRRARGRPGDRDAGRGGRVPRRVAGDRGRARPGGRGGRPRPGRGPADRRPAGERATQDLPRPRRGAGRGARRPARPGRRVRPGAVRGRPARRRGAARRSRPGGRPRDPGGDPPAPQHPAPVRPCGGRRARVVRRRPRLAGRPPLPAPGLRHPRSSARRRPRRARARQTSSARCARRSRRSSRRRRESATAALREAWEDPRYRAVMATLVRWYASLPVGDDVRVRPKRTLRKARRKVRRRLARATDAHGLHQARKAAKRLRYAGDLLEPAWPKARPGRGRGQGAADHARRPPGPRGGVGASSARWPSRAGSRTRSPTGCWPTGSTRPPPRSARRSSADEFGRDARVRPRMSDTRGEGRIDRRYSDAARPPVGLGGRGAGPGRRRALLVHVRPRRRAAARRADGRGVARRRVPLLDRLARTEVEEHGRQRPGRRHDGHQHLERGPRRGARGAGAAGHGTRQRCNGSPTPTRRSTATRGPTPSSRTGSTRGTARSPTCSASRPTR